MEEGTSSSWWQGRKGVDGGRRKEVRMVVMEFVFNSVLITIFLKGKNNLRS